MEKCHVLDPPTICEDVLDWGLSYWGKKTLSASIVDLFLEPPSIIFGGLGMKLDMVVLLGLKTKFCRKFI